MSEPTLRCKLVWRWIYPFISKPQRISVLSKNVPPYDKNGKGTPTTGTIPITIAMLMNICAKNATPTPAQIIEVKRLFAR